MEINFKLGNEDKNIGLNNIYLSLSNPRYSVIGRDNQLIDIIKKDELNAKNQFLAFKKLLSAEGNLEDMVSLLESINKFGYENETLDKILVIQKNQDYIVAEGNRRLTVLKLLNNDFNLEDIQSDFVFQTEESIFDNNEDDDNKSTKDKSDNFKKCLKLIQEIRDKKEIYNIQLTLMTSSSELSQAIYSKHLTGEKRGMRKWSRSKYYAQLIKMSPNGLQNMHDFKIFNRTERFIKSDYKQAQFVYCCFYYTFSEDLGYVDFEDNNIIDKMISSLSGISALESNHSISKILEEGGKLKNISKESFKQKYFNYSFDENNSQIIFDEKNIINNKDMFQLIFKLWKKKIITTRLVKKENIEEFKSSVLLLISGNIDLNNYVTLEQLQMINEFDLSSKDLQKLIKVNENNECLNGELERFKISVRIKDDSEEFKKLNIEKLESLDKTTPLYVFHILKDQLNDINDRWINARASTIRSILEQVFLWMPINHHWILKEEHLLNTDPIPELLIDDKISLNSTAMRKEIMTNRSNFQEIFKISYKDDITPLTIDEQFNFFNKNFEDIKNVLNNFIHSSHSIYVNSKYISNLKKLEQWQRITIEILKCIDFEKMSNLNKELEKLLIKNNEFY